MSHGVATWVLLFLAATTLQLADAHFIMNYPMWRGYSWHTQFQFPCGGIPPSTNRSSWPTTGGAISFVPLHAFALTTVNIALGNSINEQVEVNPYGISMVPFFNQTGGNGTFCIPKVKIPKKIQGEVKAGDNATIQVIQLTATGAALYNCLDITFSNTEADRFAGVWDSFCFNSTGMGGKAIGNNAGPPTNETIHTSAARSTYKSIEYTTMMVAVGLGIAWGL